jgi:hypothetical protein
LPEVPLKFSSLPPEIQEKLSRIRASVSFATEFYVPEEIALRW